MFQITSLVIVYLTGFFFRHWSKKTSKLRVTDLCEGKSPVTGEFPAQRANNAENVSIWWRHHVQIHWTHVPHHSRFNTLDPSTFSKQVWLVLTNVLKRLEKGINTFSKCNEFEVLKPSKNFSTKTMWGTFSVRLTNLKLVWIVTPQKLLANVPM